MKKQQYVAVVACLIAGAIGFASVYATEKAQEKKQLAQKEQQTQQGSTQKGNEQQESTQKGKEDLSEVSHELAPKPAKDTNKDLIMPEPQINEEPETEKTEPETEKEDKPAVVSTVKTQTPSSSTKVTPTLHFNKESGIVWPIQGEVLLDYSMDSTIYFPTLDQYRCNPAMVISGAVNDKVFAMARGKIIEVFNSAETGCTVRQDLGDGYIATYGQLKELNFGVGDMVESGQVVGYISEPTKYYSVEGANVYFSLKKDGAAVNPRDYLPLETIDTFE